MTDNYSSEFYAFLKKKGLNYRNVFDKLEKWDSTRIIDFANEAHLILLESPVNPESLFTFSANSTLSGAPFPCFSPVCRLENLDSVVKFSALYSDKVYLTNPFEKYVYTESTNDFTKTMLAGDILGMLFIRPFLDDGIIAIQNNINFLCEEHLAEMDALEAEVEKEIEKARKTLAKMYMREVKVSVASMDEEVYLSLSGPEHLIEHGQLDLVGDIPQSLLQNYTLGNEKELSKKEIRDNHLFDRFVNQISRDLFQQSVRVHLYKTQYLTDRKVELDLTSTLDKRDVAQASKSLLEGLAHAIPTLETVEPQKLLDLRRKEGEAFEVYRDKLQSALSKSTTLSTKELKQMVQDEIDPEIHKIENTIKKEKRLLLNSLKDNLIIGAGYIAIGIFSGLLSAEAKEIITAVGGISFASSVAKSAIQLRREPPSVLENPYYFLWRTKKL
jgi:F0F1-type ATP synthase membrane subunit b/b'